MRRPAHARAAASVLCVATFALEFVASARTALLVRETPIRPLSTDSRLVEQVWTVSAPPEDPAATLDALSISVLGDAFVSFDPSAAVGLPNSGGGAANTVAIVRVAADTASELSSLSVSADARADGWRQLSVFAGARLADAVTEVVLTQPTQVQLLRSSGRGDVVVGDQVLFGSPPRFGVAQGGIDVSGYGTVFVQLAGPLEGRFASLNVSGSGDLQIEASSIQFTSLSVTNSGAGAVISLFADSSDCATSNFVITESGDVCWDITRFQTSSLAVALSGSGSVTAVGSGTCDSETVAVSGSGDAALDAIECRHVQVNLSGSGDAVVQASQFLGGVVSGSGSVTYTSQEPLYMSGKNGEAPTGSSKKLARRSSAPLASKTCKKRVAPTNKLKRANAAAAAYSPPFEPEDSDGERDWNVGDSGRGGDSAWSIFDEVRTFIGANLYVVIPVVLFVGFWTIMLALSRRAHRRRRDPEQHPLLRSDEEDPPVYI